MPSKVKYYCSICSDGIYSGEEYIENDDGEYIHYDCIQGTRQLLDWLGYDVRIIEDDYG